MKQDKNDSGSPGPNIWYCIQLPATAYQTALELQRALVDARIDQKTDANIPDVNVLLLLEHPPVFTLGRRGGRENLVVSETFLKESGISIVPVERGGNITYHGPGQLVGYPIINLKNALMDVHTYVRRLEDIMIRTAGDYGVDAGRNSKNPGVWVGNNKMGSIGISIRHGITFHGFALNVNPAMEPFSWINPCGMNDIGMTSIENELGQSVSMEKAYQSVRRHIETVFDVSVVTLPETSWLQKNLIEKRLAALQK
jgi:lipoate-protein ligase B